jgi:hypothetical protein
MNTTQSLHWLFKATHTSTSLLAINFVFFVVKHIHLARLLLSTDEVLM